MNQFFQYSGIVLWILLGTYVILRLIFGKNWLLKTGAYAYFGSGLIQSIQKLIQESKKRDIQEETVAEVGAHVVWRLTRIGIFAILIATVPFILLFQQNLLIGKQNVLIDKQTRQDSMQTELLLLQNNKIDQQIELFEFQNKKVTAQTENTEKQTDILETQNRLFGEQNKLVAFQNSRIDTQLTLLHTQNMRINVQNNLMEADRRSSLVFLMSNILDKVDDEIKEQKFNSSKHENYSLSEQLINRIVALSKAFGPYRVLEGDSLSSNLVSPERGQLFIALLQNKLDSATRKNIFENADFSYSVIREINLKDAELSGVTLRWADLQGARLEGAKLKGSKLHGTNLSWANLIKVDFSEAELSEADLNNSLLNEANLRRANLSGTNLSRAELEKADLSEANFEEADLRETYLIGANLSNAEFRGATLRGMQKPNIKNLFARAHIRISSYGLPGSPSVTSEQLLLTKSLFQCELDSTFKEEVMKIKPCLFTEEGCPEEEE